ncbi:hypothetical protein [Methanobacterium formicicum]|uniref:Uncharacterized protein n=1 Tax=Methanobacterium formicicum (strain DSM 3637 / PP1) TaxID=1204725 RepID=K2QFA0_METFP|nr:hypothetical protein [Methanobacterium formicicum]EKF86776.1 hypothetical protein A994_00780 [Methanobacterium formicicum DSM 3637]
MFLSKKNRVYIEDQIVPSPARRVRIVMDLLTDEPLIKLPMEKGLLEDMEIFGVNRDWFIPFLEEDDELIINLGNLDQWIGIRDERGLKHVKLDVKFILVNPEFELGRFNRGYMGIVEFTEAEEMELHITLPLGMKMSNNGKVNEIKLSKKTNESKTIFIPSSSILDKNRRRRYDFLIKPDHLKSILNPENPDELIKLNYSVTNEREYYVITVVGLGLFVFALFRMANMLNGHIEFDIRYLAAAVAFISLYITMLREKYELPFRKVLIYTTIFIGIELILELLME